MPGAFGLTTNVEIGMIIQPKKKPEKKKKKTSNKKKNRNLLNRHHQLNLIHQPNH